MSRRSDRSKPRALRRLPVAAALIIAASITWTVLAGRGPSQPTAAGAPRAIAPPATITIRAPDAHAPPALVIAKRKTTSSAPRSTPADRNTAADSTAEASSRASQTQRKATAADTESKSPVACDLGPC